MAPDPIGDHVAVASAEQLLRDQALAALTDHAVGAGQVTPWQSGLVLDHIRDLTALVRLLAAAPAGSAERLRAGGGVMAETRELTDREMDILAADLGLTLTAPDPVTVERSIRVAQALFAERCCERWPHRLEAP